MGEKLDLFEMTVKRGLEHHEMPLDKNAWNAFKGNLGGAPSAPTVGVTTTSFLSKFGLAAAVLTGVGLFINYSASEHQVGEAHSDQFAEHTDWYKSGVDTEKHSNAEKTADALNSLDERTQNISAETFVVAENNSIESSGAETVTVVNEDVSIEEANRINRINNRLQKAASEEKKKTADGELEKRLTTRYVGTTFNLGAVTSFTPNNDGYGDFFLPEKIKQNDIFVLTITTSDGSKIFQSNDVENPWLGQDTLGNPVAEGRYAWQVTLQEGTSKNKEVYRGTVRLAR